MNRRVGTLSVQFGKKCHIVIANSDGTLINFDTLVCPSPFTSCPLCTVPQAFRFSRYRRWFGSTPASPFVSLSLFHLHSPDRPLCSPLRTKKGTRRSLRARRRENTSALYIFLDRPGHNSGDESVLLGPHRTHTLTETVFLPSSAAAPLPFFLSSHSPSPSCRSVRRLRLLGAIRVDCRRPESNPLAEPSSTDLPTPPLSRAPSSANPFHPPPRTSLVPIRSASLFHFTRRSFSIGHLPGSTLVVSFGPSSFSRRSVRPSVNLPLLLPHSPLPFRSTILD